MLLAALLGCDRNVEPFVPGEEPRRPDLSKIFPPGAEQTARSEAPPELPPAPGARAGADASAAAPPIEGVVSVAPELAAQAEREGGVLFVIARPGPAGPPLAVLRIPSPRFPLRFSIGPEDRMIRTLPFAGELQLTARLDFDGDATSRGAGDLQGRAPGAYAPGAREVAIVLDEGL
jgi:hypothetical protein